VGQRIAAATARNDYQWEFKVLEDTQANAFCLPGGKVAVYTGILPITRDDAGLAAVLGHEVSHAIARHGGERMSQTLVVQTSLAATQTALAGNDPLVVQSVTALLGAGASVGLLLPWSRPGVRSRSSRAHLHGQGRLHPIAARDLGSGWARPREVARRPRFPVDPPLRGTRVTQIEAWMPEALEYYHPR
jgi:hypothetical protein